ncbi:type II toxin-antitoxin system RelE/ParE family toxin [Amycolatopsis sp. MtRt-6]|uniref:type II toxin-antitoxin system RelE/ParE family toxin n=1 Tax=Amycolatopsis sp. MtRt-6 TaxID=2792782 RepID=UPI001A8E0D66|nr:type II toxin-antitoxin system RelE/ParE family toxin [Amycolatopsis sp. MtRt-6]
MEWEIELHDEVDRWFVDLCREDPVSADRVEEAIDMLAREGPRLGRPLVDRVKGSSLHHLKELRPASAGSSEIRILFAFDPVRCALLLVAGDKSGNWKGWYDYNIPIAEKRFREHLRTGEGAER